MANLGLIGVLAGVWVIPQHALWPGYWTLLPVGGTLLILMYGHVPSLARAILTTRPLQGIGLISYSAYLWHQPVFSFLGITSRTPDGIVGTLAMVALTLGLAALSWKWVEQPFRTKAFSPLFGRGALIAAAVMVVAVAVGGHVNKGYPGRMPGTVLATMAFAESFGDSYRRCIYNRGDVAELDPADACVLGADVAPSVAIWGDSHAAMISEPLGDALGARGLALRQLTLSSCLPVPNLANFGQKPVTACPAFNAKVLDYLLRSPEIKTVVLFATWDQYLSRRPHVDMFANGAESDLFAYPAAKGPSLDEATRQGAIVREVDSLTRRLTGAGKSVIVVGALPRPEIHIPTYFATAAWHGTPLPQRYGYDRAIFSGQSQEGRDILRQGALGGAADPRLVTIIDPSAALCDAVNCLVVKGGKPLFTDGNHPSLAGTALFLPMILKQIDSHL